MIKKTYDTLSDKEKLMYDELCDFSRKLTNQLAVVTEIMQKLLDVVTRDP